MNTGHLVGYVGGLAIALGVGAGVALGAPTASADSSQGSSPGPASSAVKHRSTPTAAKSTKPRARTTTMVSTRPVTAPSPGDKRPSSHVVRTAPTAQDVLSDNSTHSVVVNYDNDPDTGKPRTLVSVVDAGTGTQIGTTLALDGYNATSPVVTADGSRAFIGTVYNDADDKPNTLVAEINTATGTQVGPTLILVGTLSNLVLSAKDTRAVVTTTWNTSDTGNIVDTGGTVVTVIDSATGLDIGGTFFDGIVSNFVPSADGNHILITTSDDRTTAHPRTSAVVIDTVTGTPSSPFLHFRGDSTYAPALSLSPDASTALIMTTVFGVGTEVRVMDTAADELIGSVVTVLGYPDGPPIMAGDGTHVLINTLYYNSDTGNAVLAVIDTATGTQSGATLWVHGKPLGYPLLMPDGKHAVIVTTVKDSEAVSTKTGVAVLDITTGQQVGKTLALIGSVRESNPPTVGAGGVVIRTSGGLQTTVDPITGATRTVPVAYPWGFDLGVVSRAIGKIPLIQFVGGFLLSASFFGVLGLGVVLSYTIAIGNQILQHLGLPPIAAATP